MVSFSRLLTAEGVVRLGELRRRQGRVEEAEALFRQVDWHPMAVTGLAQLALEQGRPRDARELVERALRNVPEASRTQRAEAYELKARVEALLGNHALAAAAVAEVRSLSETVATLPLRAASDFSAGALAISDGEFEAARAHLEDAAGLYERSGAPYESARARLELASVLVTLGRLQRARTEAGAAREVLARLGAALHLGRAEALLREIAERARAGPAASMAAAQLTERQVEVLRLIARGLNDREIAAALVVSEHTVHRHVANILERLNLPSRAAAVAHASANGLI
jgi:ATP/maltotriose-dependent transcriptional regulator MalT